MVMVIVPYRVENGVSNSLLIWRKGEEELESRDGLLYIPALARDQVNITVVTLILLP